MPLLALPRRRWDVLVGKALTVPPLVATDPPVEVLLTAVCCMDGRVQVALPGRGMPICPGLSAGPVPDHAHADSSGGREGCGRGRLLVLVDVQFPALNDAQRKGVAALLSRCPNLRDGSQGAR